MDPLQIGSQAGMILPQEDFINKSHVYKTKAPSFFNFSIDVFFQKLNHTAKDIFQFHTLVDLSVL